uniref:UBX domain-containing protein n=1 Tax=Oryza glumipatula TaxID=40148 RepID=A0A0E0AI98_9ORYZ
MEDDARLLEFMEVTSCYDVTLAAQQLASCGWHLDRAVDLFYSSIESGGRPSSSSARHDGEASTSSTSASTSVRAPISARSDTLYGVPYPSAGGATCRRRPTRWESQEDAALRRQREGEASTSTSGYGGGRDDSDDERPPPASKKMKPSTLAELYRAPRELTYRGGFHSAKVHAARLSRWLLVNVQAEYGGREFASHLLNRDVWADETVAMYVRDNFVFWQADEGDSGGEGSKVCCYYKLDRAKLPAVLFVDPVTGQLMEKLHHITDPTDFLMAAEKFIDSKRPAIPTTSRANRITAPLSPPYRNHQKTPAATAAAKVCKLRVRFPDGQVVGKEFGGQCGVDALFAYCRSVVGVEQPFRVMRMPATTGAKEEVREDKNVSFEELGLNMSTVYVHLD